MLQVSRANNLKIPKTLENVSGNLNSLEDKVAVKQALATADDKRFNKKKVIESIEKDKELEQIIVIYDDIDIEPGNIKIKKAGGPRNS